ncbi:MAG: DUF3164 family protein [Burkholderia gladioli]
MQATKIPDGYVLDARGRLVPEGMVKPIERLRDQTIQSLVVEASELRTKLAAFKARAFSDIDSFVEASLEQYGVKSGGTKGNVTLITYDGRYKVVRQLSEYLQFDERIQAAKELINECVSEWTKGSRAEIRVLIDGAFQVDKQGKISTTRVLSLRRLSIDHPKWKEAMRAIADSIRATDSKTYIRLYERTDASGEYLPISLDLATV